MQIYFIFFLEGHYFLDIQYTDKGTNRQTVGHTDTHRFKRDLITM